METDIEKAEPDQEQSLLSFMTTEHPLVPYDHRYFDQMAQTPQARWFSYASEWLPALKPNETTTTFFDESLPIPDELKPDQHPVIELSEWLRFFRNPAGGFFRRRLRVQFIEREAALIDEEPFWVDKLDQFQLRARLLDYQRAGVQEEFWRARLLAEGVLPDGAFGELALAQDTENLQELVDALADWPPDIATRTTFHLTFDGWQLIGSVGDLFDGQLVRYRVSALKAKCRITSYNVCYTKLLRSLRRLAITHEKKGRPRAPLSSRIRVGLPGGFVQL